MTNNPEYWLAPSNELDEDCSIGQIIYFLQNNNPFKELPNIIESSSNYIGSTNSNLLIQSKGIDISTDGSGPNVAFVYKQDKSIKEPKVKIFLGKKKEKFQVTCPDEFKIFTRPNPLNSPPIPGPAKPKIRNRKKIKIRKFDADNIKKKLKSKFLKNLKKCVNEKLIEACSPKLFKSLTQIFIIDVSKETNSAAFNLSLEELLSKNFCKGKECKESDIKKYEHNLSVLKMLEENKNLSIKSGFEYFKKMKYSQIFEEYLKSEEFNQTIIRLEEKEENPNYIDKILCIARDFNSIYRN